MNNARARLLFAAFYLPLAVLGYLASTPEETRDFTSVARHFHVMAMRDGKPLPATLATLPKGEPAITYLLPVAVIEVPGGDLHRATVLESQPDRQLVRYDYGNTVDSVSRYRAFRDRVEPVSHRVEFHPGVLITLGVLLLPAWVLSYVANWLWRRIAGEKATAPHSVPPQPQPARSGFDRAVVWLTISAIVVVVLFALVLRFL
ncbi:MAG TPA: hypothetical protein VJQ58_05940 [Burkholderiales bacterium]|nr:hypothetical protein [Burkholderiales bacterium]